MQIGPFICTKFRYLHPKLVFGNPKLQDRTITFVLGFFGKNWFFGYQRAEKLAQPDDPFSFAWVHGYHNAINDISPSENKYQSLEDSNNYMDGWLTGTAEKQNDSP